jgi:hypothetical protein
MLCFLNDQHLKERRSVMSPGTYQFSLETVTEMTGGKFDVENLVVYAVEGLCNIYSI